MFKFVRNVIICVLCVCLALGGFIGLGQLIPNQSTNTYYGAMQDKYDALMNRTEPHILMLGGSNLAFGMDTKRISEAFDMPALNLGLHAGMKRDFYLNFAKSNIMEGDVVVLVFEYSSYIEDLMTEDITWYVVDNNPEFMKMVPPSNMFNIARYYPVFLIKKVKEALFNPNPVPDKEAYRRDAFNEYGDVKTERYENRRTPEQIQDSVYIEIKKDIISDESVKAFREFAEYCRSKGARVYATCPSIDEYAVVYLENNGEDFVKYYEEKTGIDMISKVTDYILPTEYFYDSDYHLNLNGVRVRTDRLIEDLKKVM